MVISLRRATPDDSELLCRLIGDLARYEKEEESLKVTANTLTRHLSDPNPPFSAVLAECDGRAAGFALYFFAYSTWEGARTLYLEDLFVMPQDRGSGIGAKLMSFLATIAQESGCRRFEWSVLDWNRPAIDFYQKIGARPVSGWTRYRLDADGIDAFAKKPERSIA
jgi:GNAT superfamily N-acetyltransferase